MNLLSVIMAISLFLSGAASAVAASTDSSSTQSTSALVYILGSLLAGSLATAGVNLYKAKKLGKAQGDQLIASAMHEAVSAAQTMLVQYREDLAHANQVKVELTDILVKRNETIASLEEKLKTANGEKSKLKQEYEDNILKLATTREELTKCREKEEDLEVRVQALEAMVSKASDKGVTK